MWFLEPGLTFQSLLARISAILLIVFLVLPFHEYIRSLVAYKLGDDTPKLLGKLTINPLVHFSVLGAVSLLLFDFGWAKHTPINPRNLKNPKRDLALIGIAGPVSYLLAALVGGLFLNFVPFAQMTDLTTGISQFIFYFISINVSLAVFNLIPIAPLDGFLIIEAFIPRKLIEKYYRNSNIISWIIIFLLLFGFFNQPIAFLERVLYNLIIKFTHISF